MTARQQATSRTFAAGSYVVRMDQPYSRIADALLDRQYWSPKDPQQHPYDDTAWSMGDLFNVQVVRVTDNAILKAPMSAGQQPSRAAGTGRIDIPSGEAAAHRADAHLAGYADRRLVAHGAGQAARAVHLHQHAGCGARSATCMRSTT
jgi:hypothetical protein